MKITAVTASLYRIPPTVRWEDATHQVTGLEYVITQVTTDSGLTGTGFTYTTGIGGSAVLSLVTDYCAAMLVGRDPLDIKRSWQLLNKQLHRCGCGGINTLALASLDIALWDIAGQYYNQPLQKLLGGVRSSVPAYGSGIDLFLSEDELLEHVSTLLDQGFQAIKIKVGCDDPDEDMARVEAVQKLIGPKRQLMVDANQSWMVPEAVQRLGMLQSHCLHWLEEPLHPQNIAGHADLRRLFNIPLAVGESLYTKHQFQHYLSLGAMDVVQADVCRVGGITEWLRIANLAAAYHRPMAPHYLAEISVAVLCGIDNSLILEWVRGGTLSEMGVLEEPLRLEEGVVYPFEAPGHGIKFDFDRLAQYEVSSDQLQQMNLRSAK